MVNENALRDVLISLARDCKSSAEIQVSLMVEVAALRETVRALDPTFADNFELRKKSALNAVDPKLTELVHFYDEIIRRLEAGEVC